MTTRMRLSVGIVSVFLTGVGLALPGCSSPLKTVRVEGPREVDPAVARVSATRLQRDVETMAAFGTRHTMSDTASDTRGIGAARRWVKAQFEEATAGTGARVSFDPHTVEPDGRRITEPVEVVNVVCEIPGSMPEARQRLYYVLGHLDSRASDPNDAMSEAPGANDDASGVALVIELARVLAPMRLDSTVVLVAAGGEEQGLYGAALHAQDAKDAGKDIRAVLSNDMVGDPYGPFSPNSSRGQWARTRVRLFAEGAPLDATPEQLARISRLGAENDSPARTLARSINEIAVVEQLPVRPMVVYRNDRFLRGGDHTPFVRAGYPGVRFTVPFEEYNRQHQDVRTESGVHYGDTPEFVDAGYLAGVTKLNAAAIVHLANAPSPPTDARLIVADLTNDTTIRWTASPEPDVAGYEVVWRESTSPVWQFAKKVGDVTEATIPLSKDNWLFGVRAYDREGYMSPAAFPGAARE